MERVAFTTMGYKIGKKKDHGLSGTTFYHKWEAIRDRIYNRNNKRYKHYGGRGIKCLWRNFKEFKEDMYKSYLIHNKKYGGINTSIERIDNNKHYCKKNCRWATHQEQQLNRKNIYWIKAFGKKLTARQWSEITGIPESTISNRIYKYKWPEEQAVSLLRYSQYKHDSNYEKLGKIIMTDHERIKTWLADLDWHCSDTLDYMRDARKRISEMNEGYPKDNLLIEGVPCDGRCGIIHKSKTLKMRRLNPNVSQQAQNGVAGQMEAKNEVSGLNPLTFQNSLFVN